MKRKLISFLGTGFYDTASFYHESESGLLEYETPFIQLALTHIFKPEEVVVFLTPEAEKMNWLGEEKKKSRHNGKEYPETGLKGLSQKLFPEVSFVPVFIPGEQGEKETWEIFEKFHSQLQPGDSVLFDITHSFRSIPVIGLACLQYAGSFKDIRLQGIYYGNWEARTEKEPEKAPLAPIEDVTSFVGLMDWSHAVREFQNHGQVVALLELLEAEILPRKKQSQGKDEETRLLSRLGGILRDTRSNIATCRGRDIYTREPCQEAADIVRKLQGSPSTVPAFYPLLELVLAKLEQLRGPEMNVSDEVRKGFGAVGWCLEHGLVQQAYTLLQENMKTWLCQRFGLDYTLRSERDLVGQAMTLSRTPENEWRGEAGKRPDKVKQIQKQVNQEIVKLYDELNQKRNDLNHAGMVDCVAARNLESKIRHLHEQLISNIGSTQE
ncbi:TIGR02221 family CRISPR-associated protein [Desulfonatronospira sp.]|uniref:TIGR02221 family CRISPR-associated protein n=1 Tax=Desulfonatronospira sp. TaxID=1962951 RepID=UPI0025C0D14A|nr:TIGR02221 family CRISPR-associated protein [Desulfonatronospira sp.]